MVKDLPRAARLFFGSGNVEKASDLVCEILDCGVSVRAREVLNKPRHAIRRADSQKCEPALQFDL